jgi:N-acetylated-alpha-linked acidic dipeptidase
MREKAKVENELIAKKAYQLSADPTEGLKTPTAETEVPFIDFSFILNALSNLEKAAAHLEQAKVSADVNKINNLNAKIFAAEQQLLSTNGLPRRPWFKHTIYAPGFYTGYGVKTIPGVREAIEQKNWSEAKEQINQVAAAIEKLSSYLDAL